MDAAEYDEYLALCVIHWNEFSDIAGYLPNWEGVSVSAEELRGDAAERAVGVFISAIGSVYEYDLDGDLIPHITDGRCTVCHGECDVPETYDNMGRFRRMLARLIGLCQDAIV